MTHDLAHLIIFSGYIVAMVLVPVALARLVRISKLTIVSGAMFFLFCGVTHVGLVFDESDAAWISATDHVQAVAIWAFALSLTLDLNRAAHRLAETLARFHKRTPI